MRAILLAIFFLTSGVHAQSLEGYVFNNDSKDTNLFQKILQPFTTDGCSRYSNGPKENPTEWLHCCVQHDAAYWLGGTKEERKIADTELYECVAATGNTADARIMYTGTRAGGGPLRYTTYRWGYGWNRIRSYAPISEEELDAAESLYGENLEELTKTIKENKFIVEVPESYVFQTPFPYTYCDEQIINELAPKLKRAARVTESKRNFKSSNFQIHIRLDICEEAIKFEFTPNTTAKSCTKDYAYSNTTNRIINTEISKSCLARMND